MKICQICGISFNSKNIYCSKKCANTANARKRAKETRFSTEEFIKRAKAIHGDTYDYSESKYETGRKPIKIKCQHGEFWQTAGVHLQGYGCKKCTNLKRYGVEYNLHSPRCREKYEQTCLDRHGVKYPLQNKALLSKCKATWKLKDSVDIKKIQLKKQETLMSNYGVTNPSFSEEILKKISDTRIQNGTKLDPSVKSEYDRYYTEVLTETERTYRSFKSDLDPDSIRGSDWHLDHIFSISDGFRNGVPVNVISSKVNLRLISATDNCSKNYRSDMTLDQLYENYESEQ